MIQFNNFSELLNLKLNQNPKGIIFFEIYNNKINSYSYQEFYLLIQKTCNFLKKEFKIRKNSIILTQIPNCIEWELIQFAALQLGAIIGGIDIYESKENIKYIIDKVRPSLIIQDQRNIAISGIDNVPNLKIDVNQKNLLTLVNREDKHAEKIHSGEILTFSSGTTGYPKALTYDEIQVIKACYSIINRLELYKEKNLKNISWLPAYNLFQRVINFIALIMGAETYILENPRDVFKYCSRIGPQIFIGVPRIYEKIMEQIESNIDGTNIVLRKILRILIKLGEFRPKYRLINKLYKLSFDKIFDLLFKKPIFGKNIKYAISGSSKLNQQVIKKFWAIGIPVYEAYGVSECIIPIALNTPKEYQIGSVGKVLPENEVTINRGQIILRSEGIYKRRLDINKKNKKHYLETGDLGYLTDEGFLYIHGRINNEFKLSTGKKIIPEKIEEELNNINYFDQLVIVGKNRKFVLVICTLKDDNIDDESIKASIIKAAEKLPKHWRPAGVIVSSKKFSIKSGELTHNLKIKRFFVEQKYSHDIEDLIKLIEEKNQFIVKRK